MKHLHLALAAVVLMVSSAAVVNAAPVGDEVPSAVLSDLGLAGMERLTDAEGEAIRGKFLINPEGGVADSIRDTFAIGGPVLSYILTSAINSAIGDLNTAASDFVQGLTGGFAPRDDFYLFN